jgi:hypothetical protein
LFWEPRDDTRFLRARHVCAGAAIGQSDRPDIYVQQAAENVDLCAAMTQAAALRDAQRSCVIAVDD